MELHMKGVSSDGDLHMAVSAFQVIVTALFGARYGYG